VRLQAFYPLQWVLPTGHVFMYSDGASCMLDVTTGEVIEMGDHLVLCDAPSAHHMACYEPLLITSLAPLRGLHCKPVF
jgi:hypothetical protein